VSDLMTTLSDPNVAFLLLMIGLLGIAVEFVHPNLLTGLLGAAALILSFIGFMSLPVNWLGLVILAFGFLLLVLETQITSHGLLALGGIAAVAIGATLLYNEPTAPGAEPVHVSPVVLVVTIGGLVIAILGLSFVAARTRRMRAPSGQLGAPVPVGTPGVVQAPLAPLGSVQLSGETWSARTADERLLPRATPVRLVGFDGLTAIVEPVDPADPAGPPGAAATTSIDPSAAPVAAHRL
jgi:membrane-bound serine protease (ClpP class)